MVFPWQVNIKQTLDDAVRNNKLHHALILQGKQGIGKSEFATCFAAQLLCATPVNTEHGGQACGQCKSCLLIAAKTHPDLLNVQSQAKSIGVDEIRTISDFVHSSSSQSHNKVAVILEADKMTLAAANALLKTLEEPNPARYLILTVADQAKLPATIYSRCMTINMMATDTLQVKLWLDQLDMNLAPWHVLFYQQPLLLKNWHQLGYLSQIDSLYFAIQNLEFENIITHADELFKLDEQFISVFQLFLISMLNQRLIAKQLSFAHFHQMQTLIAQFDHNHSSTLGLNVALATKQLVFSLQTHLNS